MTLRSWWFPAVVSPLLALLVVACDDTRPPSDSSSTADGTPIAEPSPGADADDSAGDADQAASDSEALGDASPRPDWLGQRVLPVRDDGFGEIRDTPEELVDRRLPPPAEPGLAPPPDGEFAAAVGPVPDEVVARSTWREECPVSLDALRYLTVSFWGFDDRAHTGELIVHERVAEDVVGVFEALFEARFPIEELRVIDEPELDAPPTGDGNTSTAFVCREKTTSASWSEHASGLAVDINPFHNPYVRGDVLVPELASAYTDREDHRPGMIQPGDVVVEAFSAIGWGWGGDWSSAKDWMHFSQSGS